jgi:acyl-[acyl-carrier-protein] desaturase
MSIKPDPSIIQELEEQRPPFPVSLLSRPEKDRLIERGVTGLYRWYLARSQAKRNWNPDVAFNWPALRTDHSPLLNHIIEGFFAVEQFVPDYTARAIDLVRSSYGRSHFHIRWGAEEERHADLWLNAMLFLRARSPEWIREYAEMLHQNRRWFLPWADVPHLNCYVVIQERATQLNYLNTALIASGKSNNPELGSDVDPVLAHAAKTIAVDEAAHYHFFLEITRLYLYYYPAETLQALLDVINHFTMPALDLIRIMPDVADFEEATYRAGVYTPRQHVKDVLDVVFKNLGGIANRKTLAQGLKRSRQVPDPDGNLRNTALFEVFDYDAVESAAQKLFGRIKQHEQKTGLAQVDPTEFRPSGLGRL